METCTGCTPKAIDSVSSAAVGMGYRFWIGYTAAVKGFLYVKIHKTAVQKMMFSWRLFATGAATVADAVWKRSFAVRTMLGADR